MKAVSPLARHRYERRQYKPRFLVYNDIGRVIEGRGLEVDDNQGDIAIERQARQHGGGYHFEGRSDDQEQVTLAGKGPGAGKCGLRYALPE